MNIFVAYVALFCCVGSTLGAGPVAPAGLASPLNPYYPGRYPLAPGNSPYYNPASATAPILSYSNNHGLDGSYSYSFTTGDGKQAQENGFLKNGYIDQTGAPQGTQVKEGSFAYTSPEGIPIQLSYVADENGFRHSGVNFPADGRGIAPSSLFGGINGAYNPPFNPNNPYNYYGNRFGQFGSLGQNNPLAPFNGRYPYDQRYNFNNPFPTPAAIGKDKKA